MKHATITNIKYDGAIGVRLPKIIKTDLPDDVTDKNDIEEYLSDHISNTTGFCHKGFNFTINEKE